MDLGDVQDTLEGNLGKIDPFAKLLHSKFCQVHKGSFSFHGSFSLKLNFNASGKNLGLMDCRCIFSKWYTLNTQKTNELYVYMFLVGGYIYTILLALFHKVVFSFYLLCLSWSPSFLTSSMKNK